MTGGQESSPLQAEQPHGSTEPPITRQCTATSKRSGQRCRKSAMRGRTVCLAHGGRTPRGAASPHFKTGRYSRSLPGHLVAAYERALADPTLLSLRDEVALTDAMIAELLGQLDDHSPDTKYRRVFRQIGRLIERRRRLVETEVRHIVLAREMLTAEEALTLVESIVAIMTRYLPDPTERQRIAEEIHALISTQESEIPLSARNYV
jgi:hypothetical protein